MKPDSADKLHDEILARLRKHPARERKRLLARYRRWRWQEKRTQEARDEEDFGPVTPDFLEALERANQVSVLLEGLPMHQRMVVYGQFMRGLGRAEVAQELGLTESAVRSLRDRAMRSMRTRAKLRDFAF